MFVPILAYHKVQDDFDFSLTRITPTDFERQIRYLFDCDFTSASICDFVKNGRCSNAKRVIITFDDAYESVFEHALPILSKYRFTATIFVITDFVGQWNRWDYNLFGTKTKHCTWTQLKRLAAEGWEIGSHTASHRNLPGLTASQVMHELIDSKDRLEQEIVAPVNVVSYPFGRFDRRVLDFAQMAGYCGGCTLGTGYSEREFTPFTLSRRGVYLLEPFNLFKVKLQNNIWSHYDDLKQRAISFCSHGSAFLRYFNSRQNLLD